MDWIEIFLQGLQLSVSVLTYRSVLGIGNSQINVSENEETLANLRNVLFKFYEQITEINTKENDCSIDKLINIGILKDSLFKSHIDASIFPQFADKEFFLKLKNALEQSYQEISKSLTDDQRSKANSLLDQIILYREYCQFINYFTDGVKYITAKNEIDKMVAKGENLTKNSNLLLALNDISVYKSYIDYDSFLALYNKHGMNKEEAITTSEDIRNQINNAYGKVLMTSGLINNINSEPNRVKIVFERPYTGSAWDLYIRMDGKEILRIPSFEYNSETSIFPGLHSFRASDKSAVIEIGGPEFVYDCKAGKIIHFQIKPHFGGKYEVKIKDVKEM